jgi:hypothetical protein
MHSPSDAVLRPLPGGDQDDYAEAHMTAGQYIATRFSSLKPPMTPLANPFSLLAQLSTTNWLFFGVAFAGWTWVSVTRNQLITRALIYLHRMLLTSSLSH